MRCFALLCESSLPRSPRVGAVCGVQPGITSRCRSAAGFLTGLTKHTCHANGQRQVRRLSQCVASKSTQEVRPTVTATLNRKARDQKLCSELFRFNSLKHIPAKSYLHAHPAGMSNQRTFSMRASENHVFPVPQPGCYAPAITFFDPKTEHLRLDEQSKYYSYLASTGLTGLVILGTNAETFLLTREERKKLIQVARQSVPQDYPIIAGVSGHSNVQVLEYINDAYEAGADFVLLLPCAYFGKQTTPAVVKGFFSDVARASPLPIVLYNFPAVCNGLDLDSEIITEISNANDNVVGVKLTCGSVAKIARLAATFPPERFAVFGGQSDFLLGGLAVGSAGCIAAFGNVLPRSVVRIYELWKDGRQEEALALQKTLSLAESPMKAGIACTKYAASLLSAPAAGINDPATLLRPRRPYLEPDTATKAKIEQIILPLQGLEFDMEGHGDGAQGEVSGYVQSS